MTKIIETLKVIVENEFSDILLSPPEIIKGKLHVVLKDHSFVEIRYPLKTDYSFHWHREKGSIRVNTAPHFKDMKTYPRHIHNGEKVEEDTITDLKNTPEVNTRNFFTWAREKLKHSLQPGSP